MRLQFTAGKAVMLHTASRAHPVTVTPLTEAQIRKFFDGTDVAGRIPSASSPAATHNVRLLKTPYEVEIAKQNGALSIEVRPGSGDAAPPAAPVFERPPSPAATAHSAERPTRRDTPIPGTMEPLSERELARKTPTKTDTRPQRARPVRAEPATPTPRKREPSHKLPLRRDVPTRTDADAVAAPKPVQRETSAHLVVPSFTKAGTDPRKVEAAGRQLQELLQAAREVGASDVHIVSDQAPRIRVAGMLRPEGSPTPHDTVACMLKPLLELRHHEQLAARGYADLGLDVEGAGRMRLNACRQRTGLKACFRMVAAEPPTWEELGLPEEVEALKTHHQGLVLISGPNGHGKTTSMAALVDMFNQAKPLHIITVEDPVEVLHPVKQAIVTQREVGTHTKTFQSALAGALREDPDIIAIGELRDRETVEMALQASETGHLVLATMSTPSGAKTIDRVIDMFPPDDQAQVRATLAGALKFVLSQRLLRRRNGSGLIAAFELLTGNIPLWSLIRDNKLFQLPSLQQRGRAFGMIRLEDSLKALVRDGDVDPDEAMRYAIDKKAMSR